MCVQDTKVLRRNPVLWATRWSGFVLVLSFVLLIQGHYGAQAGLKYILCPSLLNARLTGIAASLG